MVYRLTLFVLTALAIGWTAYGTVSYFHDRRVLRSTPLCLNNEISRRENELRPEGSAVSNDQRFLFGADEVRMFELTCNARVVTPNIDNVGRYYLRPGASQNNFEPTSLWMSNEPNLFDMILLGIVAGVSALALALIRNVIRHLREEEPTLLNFQGRG